MLYVAANTRDQANGADKVYTQRAVASWQFNGSGDIDADGVWHSSCPGGVGNSGSTGFSPVTSGAVVPVTTGATCNQLTDNERWFS
jgi:hypothetical protein